MARIYSCNSDAVWLRANESGSSGSGSSTTRTFMPSFKIMSIPRNEA